jgi:hypothetical protein
MAKNKDSSDNRAFKTLKSGRKEQSSANSMGVVIADPAVKPREVSSTKIRDAVHSIAKKY